MRSYFPQRWDITISANWIDDNKGEALKYLVSKAKDSLKKDEFSLISAIIMIKTADPALLDLQSGISIQNSPVEIKNFEFAGRETEHAFIITSLQKQIA